MKSARSTSVTLFKLKDSIFSDVIKSKPIINVTHKEAQQIIVNLNQEGAISSKYKINTKSLDTNGVGICALWGRRANQDDASGGGSLPGAASQLSEKAWRLVLSKTFARIQKHLDDKYHRRNLKQGSSFCAAIVIGDKIIIANLGNSESILVTMKNTKQEDDSCVSMANATVLNKPHDATNEEERARVHEEYNQLYRDFLCADGLFSVISRSFGNPAFEKVGLSHEPEITFNTIPSSARSSYLIIACDGLRDGLTNLVKTNEEVNQLIAKKMNEYDEQGLFTENMAEQLALLSYYGGSKDNISVVVIPAGNIMHQTKMTPLCYFVADGHGYLSHVISNAVVTTFMPVLQEEIEKQLEKTVKKHTLFDQTAQKNGQKQDDAPSVHYKKSV